MNDFIHNFVAYIVAAIGGERRITQYAGCVVYHYIW